MRTALIGYTGFIGTNLLSQTNFDDLYNSQNIKDIEGKTYDLVVSCGTKAERWKANLEPEKDWEGIKKLLDCLEKVKAKQFILISTVDVYPTPQGVDEDTKIYVKQFSQAYGKNRYKMEEFIKANFSNVLFVRLPQLFGIGLKKNFVYDLINDNALDFTDKNSHFQWYNLKNLWKDIQIAIKSDLFVVNFAVEPISARDLAKYTRDLNFKNETKKPPLIYNVQTKNGKIFVSPDKYIYHKKSTLIELKRFITKERKKL